MSHFELGFRVFKAMSTKHANGRLPYPIPTESPDEPLADLRRRRTEAADVLAETLLEMWLREKRAGRTTGARLGESERNG